MNLTNDEAGRIARGVLSWGREHESGRLTAAVLDAGGHLIVLERDDGSEFLRVDVAQAKAWGALGMGLPTRVISERMDHVGDFFRALSAVSKGRVIPVPGGVLIRRDGIIVGAVGVSGDRPTVDEDAAIAAIAAIGLQADYGQVEEWLRP